MNKKLFLGLVAAMLLSVGTVMAAGWSGYNYKARIFVGTCEQWCTQKPTDCSYCGVYLNDKITMKWNAEWDRGNDEGWSNPPYDAWENNEWNGMFPGGSGAVWHYKIKWVGDCETYPDLLPEGSYCIWGQFATIMDQGVDPNYGSGHIWFAHGLPTGYGA